MAGEPKVWAPRAVVVAALMAAAACGGSTAPSATTTAAGSSSGAAASVAPDLGTVSLRTGAETVIGPDVPFVVAIEKGFYKSRGLTVTFGNGTGYATALRTVASGADQYAETDVATVAKAVAQGLPVKSVAIYVENNPAGLIYHSSKPITSPASITGWRIGGTAGSGSKGIFDTWVAVNHLSPSSYTFDNIPGHAKAVLFSQNKLDAYIGLAFDDYPDAQKLNGSKNVGFYYFASSGVSVPGLAIAASTSEIKNHPDRVRAFVAATAEGAQYAVAHSDQVPALVAKLQPGADASLVATQWAVVRDAIEKFAVAGKPFGYQRQAAWQATAKLFAPSDTNNLGAFYTNAYLGN